MNLRIANVQRPARGETVCGDAFTVVTGQVTIVALADGLGHGPLAAEASEAFCAYVERHEGQGLEQLLRGGTVALNGTRGAAAAVLRIDQVAGRVSFAGVGNIELQAVSREPIRPVCTPGIVGRPLRKVIAFHYNLHAGDLLALYSDGISSRFDLAAFRRLRTQGIAQAVLAQHGKSHDDATILVLRV
jgi:negative regulator of sigma-B (phosphoserine phosphatase)